MARTDRGRKRTWRFRLNEDTILEVSAPEGPTEKQVRRRGRISFVLAVGVAALAAAAVALADGTGLDGDTTKSPVNVQYADTANSANHACTERGTSVAGVLTVTRNGSTHYNSGATVTVTVTPSAAAVAQGITATGGSETVPSGTSWDGNGDSFTIAISTAVPATVANGTYAISVGTSGPATNNQGTAVTQTFTDGYSVIVDCSAPSNTPPTADAGGPYSGNEGSAVSLTGSGSTDSDGTIASYSWSYAVDTADAGASCSFSDATAADPTITCNDDGSYTVKLTVTDDDGADSAEDTATLTVSNADPVINSFTCPAGPVAVDTTVSLGGSFTDAGTNDTHTASYAWGDSSSSPGTVTQGAGSGSVSGSHVYASAGIYTPSLTVTDDDTGSDTESCMYVVVYDPSAGFVTGGGWINSPAGAYFADPWMTGKATFGFVSKYKKGATTPEGNTEFQFHAAGLNFKSTSYQWLVVSGSKATYKGYGTVNGAGNYGFLLSAIDGTPDKFRIKIWEVGGDVVYDNNLGGGDDAEPATALGGGSIVIHTGAK